MDMNLDLRHALNEGLELGIERGGFERHASAP
jgi:hypothetical protein